MARAIDADALMEKIADVLDRTYTDDYAKGFVAGIYAALSMPTLTPPNEPLTLEQLREMDGEPVWIVDVGPNTDIGLHISREKKQTKKADFLTCGIWLVILLF